MKMKNFAIAKKEISHKIVDAIDDNKSARHRCKMNSIQVFHRNRYKLVDKVIFPINICPYCKSRATYHHRIQQTGDECENVYMMEKKVCETGIVSMKWDFCFDCGRHFLIEMYVLHKIKKVKR